MVFMVVRKKVAKVARRGSRKAGQGSKWCRKSTRMALYDRDGFACVYCGRGAEEGEMLTLDHVVACEVGGTNEPGNLVTCCQRCNSRKRDLSVRSWFAELRADGVDTRKVGRRVRARLAKALDRAKGRALAKSRKVA